MPNSVLATKHLIRTWLLADAALEAEVAGNIVGAHVKATDALTLLRDKPMVVFDTASGAQIYTAELESLSIEVYTYSKASADEAMRVYDLVAARLQGQRIKVDGIGPSGSAREVDRPVNGHNDVVDAWFLRGRWLFMVIAGPE